MMVIGFRAESTVVHYAIVQGTRAEPELVDKGKISAPATFDDVAATLQHYRSQTENLILRHLPIAVGVRFSETFFLRKLGQSTMNSLFARARIEGVILEVAKACGVSTVSGCQLQAVSSNLGSKRAKAYLESGDLRGIKMTGINQNVKDAILVATSLLE